MPHPFFSGTKSPRVFAHRGLVTQELADKGVAENSLDAVRAAVDAGAHYVESDCHVTSDAVVVLFHDDDLSRVAGDPRPIASVTHRELSALMRERGGLLTLERALDEFASTRFNIDVKAFDAAVPAGQIVGPHADRVLLTSFSDERRRIALEAALSTGRASLPPATSPGKASLVRILAALASRSRRLQRSAFAGFDALQIPERHGALRVLSPRLIDAGHRHGVEVHVWTVNDPERMTELVQAGVDGIITDRADVALAALG